MPILEQFIRKHRLENQRCLEIGAGRGSFQNVVREYVGVDLARAVGGNFEKPFVHASVENLPFANRSFDAIWTYAVLEHIPNPENALSEMRRVLKPGGLILLHAAWYCRQWTAEGYPIRPYSDFGIIGKLIKASIPLRNNIIFRSMFVFPRRALHEIIYKAVGGQTNLAFRRLKPNFDKFWMADSDAIIDIDPHDVLLWFASRGDKCIGYSGLFHRFFVKTGYLLIEKATK